MLPQRVEWPTVAVAVTIWGGGAAVLAVHEHLPTPLTILILGVLAAWYGSLQHEVIHGHPTPWRSVNVALAGAPLGLVVPFSTYRATHLAHHRAPELTEPGLDPESFHVSAATWDRCGPLRRTALRVLRTLAGRMILGPAVQAATCWTGLADDARKSPGGAIRLLTHLGGVAVVLLIVDAAGMAPWVYVVGVAWVGGALSLLRSFAEHRWTASGTRSAVVHAGPAMALLYLNNNLHHTHHERPGVAVVPPPGRAPPPRRLHRGRPRCRRLQRVRRGRAPLPVPSVRRAGRHIDGIAFTGRCVRRFHAAASNRSVTRRPKAPPTAMKPDHPTDGSQPIRSSAGLSDAAPLPAVALPTLFHHPPDRRGAGDPDGGAAQPPHLLGHTTVVVDQRSERAVEPGAHPGDVARRPRFRRRRTHRGGERRHVQQRGDPAERPQPSDLGLRRVGEHVDDDGRHGCGARSTHDGVE